MSREAVLAQQRLLGRQIRSQIIRAARALTGWAPEGKSAKVQPKGSKAFKWNGLHARVSWGPTSDDARCTTVYVHIIDAKVCPQTLKDAAMDGFTYMHWSRCPESKSQPATLSCWITYEREYWCTFAGLEL